VAGVIRKSGLFDAHLAPWLASITIGKEEPPDHLGAWIVHARFPRCSQIGRVWWLFKRFQ
jgi:hypothetical protein